MFGGHQNPSSFLCFMEASYKPAWWAQRFSYAHLHLNLIYPKSWEIVTAMLIM